MFEFPTKSEVAAAAVKRQNDLDDAALVAVKDALEAAKAGGRFTVDVQMPLGVSKERKADINTGLTRAGWKVQVVAGGRTETWYLT